MPRAGLITMALITRAAIAAEPGYMVEPRLDCGIYRIEATLKQSQGRFLLVQRDGTSSPLEFILLGGELSENLDRIGTEVRAEVYVPQPIRNNKRPFLFLRKFETRDAKAVGSYGLEKVGEEACGHKD